MAKPTIIILAAGLGTRMKSNLPKALHQLAGRPLIHHVLAAAAAADPERIVLVLGHQAELVQQAVAGFRVEIAIQEQQLGTGHAVMQAADAVAAATGPVVVLCADTPLVTADLITALVADHGASKSAVTLMTAAAENPFGYGRIVRSQTGVQRIVEEKDATAAQRKIREVNAGIYCFDRLFLRDALAKLNRDNAQQEYYLTDTIAIARRLRRRVSAFRSVDPLVVMGVNSRVDLAAAEAAVRDRVNRSWMLQGVTMPDPASVFIGHEVSLGRDTTLYPNVRLEGKTTLGARCVVFPGTRIVDSTLGAGVTVKDCCVIEDGVLADGAAIGPFAHLRPGAVIGAGARIGNFVEIKKSVIGERSKANHLAYIGDASVGKDVNIGAGVITCNYDGYAKHQTVIGDNVFVGSDAQLVAPVTIGAGALIAAGATVTHDVPEDALAISRAPQENKAGVAGRRRRMKHKPK